MITLHSVSKQSGAIHGAQATTGPGSATKLAREVVQAGTELVVVCGGDGTINEVVCGMAHSYVPLAILPGGTANGFARELGPPLNVQAAARIIPSAAPWRIALGRVATVTFFPW